MTGSITGNGFQPRSAYEEAVLGFREYWYPVSMSGDITEKPKAFTLLGEPVVFLRREGKAYALKDECAHRGTQLSMLNTRKNWEFPGTCTITCPYHGWTFDVRDGRCVAVISEGPDSPVPSSGVRVRTYSVEERRGMIWVWMGSSNPMPVEEDIPKLLLDPKAVVHGIARVKYGNWRFHVENVNGGHAQMVHKSTLQSWFGPERGTPGLPQPPSYGEDSDGKGIDSRGQAWADFRPYGDLGIWHSKPLWMRLLLGWVPKPQQVATRRPVRGTGDVRTQKLMLPGIVRVPNSPIEGWMYYEWYVPVDELHYTYFQIMAFWPRSFLHRAFTELKYFFWHKATGPILFNNQDAAMVAATTKFFNRTGNMRYLTKISPNDQIHVTWRAYCDEFARGVGTAYRQSASEAKVGIEAEVAEAVIAGGSGGGS